MLNQIILVGRVKNITDISDKEKNISKMDLELDIPGRDKNDPTETINVKVNNAIAQHAMEYLQLKDVVGIKGKIKRNENNEMEIITEKLTFLSSARKDEEQENDNNYDELER